MNGQNHIYHGKKAISVPTITVRHRHLLTKVFLNSSSLSYWEQNCSEFLREAKQKSAVAKVAGHYWSASTNVNNTTNAWNVNFNNGNSNNNNKTNSYSVRCVAPGAWS